MNKDGIATAAGASCPKAEALRIQRAQAGDAKALEELVLGQIGRVEALLQRILGPRNDLEDLVQTVFLELCSALPRFRQDSSFSTFVAGITVRVARRAMRRPAFVTRRGELADEPPSEQPGPEAQVDDLQKLLHVQRALERLSAKKRIAFVLWALEGLEPKEIATITGASLSATRARIYHGQRELRQMAADDPLLMDLVGDASDR